MGIDISAKLIYGLPYSDLPEDILEEVNEMLDNGELDYASPYYDAPRDEWIVGVECELWGDNPSDAAREMHIASMKLYDLFKGCDVGFYVTHHVY